MKSTKEKAALKPDPASELRAELAGKIASLVGKEENRITEISGLSLVSWGAEATEEIPCLDCTCAIAR